MFNGCGNNNCSWIIIILILWFFCGNGNCGSNTVNNGSCNGGCNCGCSNNGCC